MGVELGLEEDADGGVGGLAGMKNEGIVATEDIMAM